LQLQLSQATMTTQTAQTVPTVRKQYRSDDLRVSKTPPRGRFFMGLQSVARKGKKPPTQEEGRL
jgi:hypothetical protein